MLVYTLKRAAGEVCFAPGETIDLPESTVEQLLSAGAVRVVNLVSPSKVVELAPAKKPRARAKVYDGTNTDS